MDNAKLKDILNKHLKWLKREGGGERADLSRADLSGAKIKLDTPLKIVLPEPPKEE